MKDEVKKTWAEGSEEAGWSNRRSTWCKIRARGRGGDEDGVGQVERSSAGGRTRVSIVVGAWRSSEARFGGLGLKITKAAGFLVWASKPRSGA